jgi:hypothetical protein
MNSIEKMYICKSCGGVYGANVSCDCNGDNIFDKAVLIPSRFFDELEKSGFFSSVDIDFKQLMKD